MEVNQKIRPLYATLQGFLSQAPLPKEQSWIYNKSMWEQFHTCIQKLNDATGNNYDDFKVNIRNIGGDQDVDTAEYRSKLNGLIMHLHSEYFLDEVTPFGGSPGIVVNQSQQQNQSVQIHMVLEMQSLIDRKLYTNDLDDKEREFLKKIKESLTTVKSFTELLSLIVTTANSMGITLSQLKYLFGF